MVISDKAIRITAYIYTSYGSDTGYLFGIPPSLRRAVAAIVQCTLAYKDIEAITEKEGDE